jgi:hypothetical protein
LLFVLIRLVLRGDGLTMALMGRGGIIPGEPGGVLVMATVGGGRLSLILDYGIAPTSGILMTGTTNRETRDWAG